MVTLFMGLFTAAGVMPERQPQPKRPKAAGQSKPAGKKPLQPPKKRERSFDSGLPAPIAGLLSSLPNEDGGWSKEQRDKFVTTFEAVIDFCYRIEEKIPSPTADQE